MPPYGTFEWLVLTRFGKWDQILAQPQPNEKNLFVNGMYHYSRGLAFAGLGNAAKALAERERMQAITSQVPEQEMLMNNSARSVLQIGLVDLEARIARINNDFRVGGRPLALRG